MTFSCLIFQQKKNSILNTSQHFSTQMDQSDIQQLTAIFAKLGYDISITKRETKQTEEKKEEIIPKKTKTDEKKDNEEFTCVPIYMPVPINDKKCMCRLEKKGIPTQCTGIRLKGKKVCTRHNKKMSGWGFYDDDEPPERTSDGKIISWKFTTKKVVVEKKDESDKEEGTTIMTSVKPKKDVTVKDMFGSDSDEEKEDKKTPVKKMTNSKHEELMKSLDEKTSEEDYESSSDEEDEYNSYGKDNDLKIENKIIDGISYTYYSDTKRLINKEHEYVGIWNGEYIEFANHHRERDHFRHRDYKRDALIVGC